MLVSSALAPDGSVVDGFEFEGRTVRYTGEVPVDAGIRVALNVRPGISWKVSSAVCPGMMA